MANSVSFTLEKIMPMLAQHRSSEVFEIAGVLLGVAVCRGENDRQGIYDDLGAILSLIQGFRQDLRTVHKVRP